MNFRSLLLSLCFLAIFGQNLRAQPDEEAAIRQIILLETYSWEQRDYDTWRACWVQSDYATHHVPLQGMTLIGWENIDRHFRETAFFSEGASAMAEIHRGKNFQIRHMGNLAHAIYVQEDILGDKVTEQFEMRLLEKVGGQWKIVSVVAAPLLNGSDSFTRVMLDRASLNHLSFNDTEKAIPVLEKHLDLFPDDQVALERLAKAHYDQGDREQAKKYYRALLELDPEHAEAKKMLADL